jgi:hypothetical protein
MHPPHPDLSVASFPDRFEARVDGFAQPIARAQKLHDGTWVAAVRPLQKGPERAAIVESRTAALKRLEPWCREWAWTYRPNVNKRPAKDP